MSLIFLTSATAYAQFNTITRTGIDPTTTLKQNIYNADYERIDKSALPKIEASLPIPAPEEAVPAKSSKPQNQRGNKNRRKQARKIPVDTTLYNLPLNLPNIVKVLRHYDIKYPRIVLAQAIQETGWLRSNVCLTKHNLFGLTNPYTGEYYEFNHWSESVRAYYTLVQYKYTSGNYYQWLEEIGYAGDPNYVKSLRKIISLYLS